VATALPLMWPNVASRHETILTAADELVVWCSCCVFGSPPALSIPSRAFVNTASLSCGGPMIWHRQVATALPLTRPNVASRHETILTAADELVVSCSCCVFASPPALSIRSRALTFRRGSTGLLPSCVLLLLLLGATFGFTFAFRLPFSFAS